MKKNVWGVLALTATVVVVYGVATLPPAPPAVPAVPDSIPVPVVPALTAYDLPTGNVPVSAEPYRSTYRSISLDGLAERKLLTGVYQGTPYWKQREQWFKDNF